VKSWADPEVFVRGGGAHGERVEREPITGVWGGAPSGVQGLSPGGESGGEAESFLALQRPTNRKIYSVFLQSVHYIYTMSGEKESMVYYA